MTFGEKLKALRKEKGYSQEEFAGLLDVFLSYKRQRAKKLAVGVGLIIISDVFGCFSDYRQILLPLYWGSMAIGIAILVWLFFQPKRYQEIYTKTLIFDDSVIKDFREESNRNRKRYVGMIILSVLLFLLGTQLVFTIERVVGNETCNALDWFVDAASVILLILAGVSIRSENIITQNTEYIKKRNSRGKFAWIYAALPITGIAVFIGFITNVWSPISPIILLFCALLITVCKLLLEKREIK